MIGVTKVVIISKKSEYIRELLSNVTCEPFGRNKSPREKAPRIFEMADPMIFPTANEGRPCAREAMTTTSYDSFN